MTEQKEFMVESVTIPDDGVTLFIIKSSVLLSVEVVRNLQGAWENAWKHAGCDRAPTLLAFDPYFTIESLTGEQLRQHGLMRIPATEPDSRPELKTGDLA